MSFVCMFFCFLSVFHVFESPGIELATVKVVIPVLNFADIHAFYYLLYFLSVNFLHLLI